VFQVEGAQGCLDCSRKGMLVWQSLEIGFQSNSRCLDVHAARAPARVGSQDRFRPHLEHRYCNGRLAIYDRMFSKQDDFTGR